MLEGKAVRKNMEALPEIDLQEVIPVTKAASTLSSLLERSRMRRQPIVVTQKGYAAGVLIDVTSFQQMREYAEKWLEYQASRSGEDPEEEV